MRGLLALAWQRFAVIASIVGDVNGRVIMLGFYFTILVPFGVGSRIFTDPMKLRSAGGWQHREPVPTDLESAQGQG